MKKYWYLFMGRVFNRWYTEQPKQHSKYSSDSVGASVRDSVGASVGAWYDAAYNSWLKFFNDNLEKNNLEHMCLFDEMVNGYYLTADTAHIIRKPIHLERDQDGNLHSETRKAIEWADGTGFYYLHGIRFIRKGEDKLWQKIVDGKLSAKELANIQDVDIRRIAMTYLTGDDFIKQMKAELVDEGKHVRYVENGKNATAYRYKLYKIKKGEIYAENKYFLLYPNASTGQEHMSFLHSLGEKVGRRC